MCKFWIDNLIYNLPTEIVASKDYNIHVPSSITISSISSDCGSISQYPNSAVIFSPNQKRLTANNNSCAINILNSPASWLMKSWLMTSVPSIFKTKYTQDSQSFALLVGNQFSYMLPERLHVLQNVNYLNRLIYTVDSPLPAGITLDAQSGIVSGAATAAAPRQVYNFFVTDSVTFDGRRISIIAISVSGVPLASASSINPLAYAVPIGVVALVVLIVWLYLRYDRRKMFHIFISYRVATDSKLAETLCFRLQQHFLSTGHRVR